MRRASCDAAAASVVRWLLLTLAGIIGGLLLGNLAVGGWRSGPSTASAQFSSHSANPDAAKLPTGGADPCLDCPDSHGVAARFQTSHNARMAHEFRELGAVDVEPMSADDRTDGYLYGGRFPDAMLRPQPEPAKAPEPPFGEPTSEPGDDALPEGQH